MWVYCNVELCVCVYIRETFWCYVLCMPMVIQLSIFDLVVNPGLDSSASDPEDSLTTPASRFLTIHLAVRYQVNFVMTIQMNMKRCLPTDIFTNAF